MSTPWRNRLREAVPSAVLAATIFIPLLLTRPGRVGADTKTYLYLDPGVMLSRATSMWDPHIGMGTVTHQNIGYLWPIGPFYWLADVVGMPDWVAQRLWLGSILFLAGLGVRFLLKTLGQEGPHVTAATFLYALTPYVLTLAARLSVILLPYAGLPWLIGLTVLALRRRRWREPALFALVVTSIGSVNATALILCGFGPLLWIFHEVVITRDVRFRDALAAVARIGVVTVGCSLWWLAGLWAQGGYGIEILRYTETAETVATASVSIEVLRGLGYWFFYGEDRFGPWLAASRAYMANPPLLLATYLIPGLALIGAAAVRFRERTFFLLLLVTGTFLAVGAHPWDDGSLASSGVRAVLESDAGLSMRSLPRAAPLVVLATSVFLGSLIAAIAAERSRWARPLTAAAMVLALAALPPLWQGRLVDANLDRAEDLPEYWLDAAAALDAARDGTRVLEVPGSDFASYRWGNTVDPVLPGLMDRPYVARELIPYGSPASTDLLNALDHRLQEQTFDAEALAPIARLMGVGDISVRSDLTYERYNTPRPRSLWDLLRNAPGVEEEGAFGPADGNVARADLPLLDEQELLADPQLPNPPEVAVLGVDDPEPIIRTAPTARPLVVAGSGEGLVDLASVGLIDGHELTLYSGSYAEDPDALADLVADHDAVLVLTDTNRKAARRWGTVRDTTGITERADQQLLDLDPKDQRLELFPDEGTDQQTITVSEGDVWADATSYGNSVSLTPEDGPAAAVDDDTTTAWRTGGFSSAVGETLRLTYREPVTTDRMRVLQNVGGVRNRSISRIDVSFDGEDPIPFDLVDASRPEVASGDKPGQILTFPERTFSQVDLTITRTSPDGLRRWDGISAVGFAEVVIDGPDGEPLVGDDVVRLPQDLLDTIGEASIDHPLAVVLTRQRVAGSVAVRSDPETSMARTFSLPEARDFALSGQVRLSTRTAADNVIDKALGIPDADGGGVTARSSRRLPGGLSNRAMNAIDGDLDTWWSPGFLDQHGEWIDYQTSEPVTVKRLELTLLNDGRHSVPRALEVTVGSGDDATTQTVRLPEIDDQAEPNARTTVDLELPKPVTGTRVRITLPEPIPDVRDVETLDWFTGDPVVMPVGFVELGIDGLEAPPTPARVDERCRTDVDETPLLTVDGEVVGISLSGTTEDLLAGRPIAATTCTDPISLDAGSVTLRTGKPVFSGFDVDRLVLRSAAGGEAQADPEALLVDEPAARPDLRVARQDATSAQVEVSDADGPFWLVLGQSHNAGWRAKVAGRDLGPSTLVDGYANGWLVEGDGDLSIQLEWRPQRVVGLALGLSALSILAALVLVFWPRRRTAGDALDGIGSDVWIPLDNRPSMPRALRMDRVLRYAGPTPSRFALVCTSFGAGLFGAVVIGPVPGAILFLAAALALRVPRARPLLTLGGPACFAVSVGMVVGHQMWSSLPAGFDWPTYFEVVHQPAWLGVALVALDAVIDRCWLRRWWPTDDSPS